MLRVWHNNRARDKNFAQITLFLSISTEAHRLIDNQHESPFNVTPPIKLQDFGEAEVKELYRRYSLPLNEQQVSQLMAFLNGHPYLTRLALDKLVTSKVSLDTLLAEATSETSPFAEYLYHYWHTISKQPILKEVLTEICHSSQVEENDPFYYLQEIGLIKRVGRQVVFRNQLYDQYFKERFKRLNG